MYDEKHYWDTRYRAGGNSGSGSRGEEGAWKARFVVEEAQATRPQTLLDLGSGDGVVGAQIMRALPEARYLGVDISPAAVALASSREAPRMQFLEGDLVSSRHGADLVLCLDVLFHLPTELRQREALSTVGRSFKTSAVVAAWNSKVLSLGKLAPHCFFCPFEPPAGTVIHRQEDLPMNPVKTMYVLRRVGAG